MPSHITLFPDCQAKNAITETRPCRKGLIQHRPQPFDGFGDRRGIAGETEAQITLAHRPEGAAGGEADLGPMQHLLGESEAVRDPPDTKKCIKRTFGPGRLDPAA